MKKLLAFIPLLAGGAWAGTTLVAGNQTEPAYNDLIAHLNERSPVPFVVESYEKGYLKSTAITKVMDSKAANADVVLRLKHEMSHSTIAMDDAGTRVGKSAITTTLLLDEPMNPDLAEMLEGFSGQAPFELISHVGVSGEAVNTLRLNPYQLEKDGGSINAGGGEVRFTVDADQAIYGSGEMLPIKAVDLNQNQELFSSEGIDLAFDMKLHESGFYQGTQSFNIESISGIDVRTGSEFAFSDFTFDANNDLSGETGNGKIVLAIGDIKSMLPVNSGSLEVSTDGLSIAAMTGFKQMMNELENMSQSDMEAAQTMMSDYAKLMTELFQGGSSISYRLIANNDGGTAATDMTINRNEDAAEFSNETTLGDLLLSLSGEINLDADGGAVDLTPMGFMLQAPPASDFISFDGNKYNSKIVLADNVIDLNGTPFPLDMMLGPYLDMSLADAMVFLQ